MAIHTKVLVSACLLGAPVRYDGRGSTSSSDVLTRWREDGRIVSICPEVAGGLAVPRPAAEIEGGDGVDVLAGRARVRTAQHDVTDAFVAGARRALEVAQAHRVVVAVLKARSPSCGSLQIYDGAHDGTLRDGVGVTAALLQAHGITVFDEDHLEEADALLTALDG